MGSFRFKESTKENLLSSLPAAKTSALQLVSDNTDFISELLDETDLSKIETGIKRLNEFAGKFWLISAIVLYQTLYTEELYKKSGLEWESYMVEMKGRLGVDKVSASLQLSAARFFIKYHKELIANNWTPVDCFVKLAKAELALELSKDLNLTIQHLKNDTMAEFKAWYSSFKIPTIKTSNSSKKSQLTLNTDAILSFSDNVSQNEKVKLLEVLNGALKAISNGQEPVVVPMQNEEEAKMLKSQLKI